MHKQIDARTICNKNKGVMWFLFGNKNCASSRIHGHLIHRGLRKIGYNSEIVYSPLTLVSPHGDFINFKEETKLPSLKGIACVVQKLRGANTDRLIERIQQLGGSVFYVNCDLEESNVSYKKADVIMTISDELKSWHEMQEIEQVVMVNEPYEYSYPPKNKFYKNARIKALWFGYAHNIEPLLDWKVIIDQHFQEEIELVICSDHEDSNYTWSYKTQKKLLESCDIVLLPSSDCSVHSKKSANRLVQAMACSLPCIVGPRPSYYQLATECPYVLTSRNHIELKENLSKLIDYNYRKEASYKSFDFVKNKYSQSNVAENWAYNFNLQKKSIRNYFGFLRKYIALKSAFQC
jgi:hypothetical protein